MSISVCASALRACVAYGLPMHYESVSRGAEDTPAKRRRFEREAAYMRRRWGALLRDDPCYSPYLTRRREDFSLREDPPTYLATLKRMGL
jgi:O-antigen biosynthesis protein